MQDTPSPYPQNNSEWLSGGAQTEPPRHNKSLPYVIVGIAVLLLIIGAAVTVTILARPACLSTSDYQDLTSVPYTDSLEPTVSFYTTPVGFVEENKVDLSTESKSILQSLASFYQKHQAKSVQFTVNGTYSQADQKAAATERTLILQEALIESGIPGSRIVIAQPELIPHEEDDTLLTQSSTISISSLEGCR